MKNDAETHLSAAEKLSENWGPALGAAWRLVNSLRSSLRSPKPANETLSDFGKTLEALDLLEQQFAALYQRYMITRMAYDRIRAEHWGKGRDSISWIWPEMPVEYADRYSMKKTIPVSWTRTKSLLSQLDDMYPRIYTDEMIDFFLPYIKRRRPGPFYGDTDRFLFDALEDYPISGMEVVNIGSLTPWYESVCIAYDARPTTIDYNAIITHTDRISVMSVDESKRRYCQMLCNVP